MNKLYTFLLLLISSLSFAQDSKTNVAIMPFQHVSKDDAKHASQLQEIVFEILAEKNSINTLDRSKDKLIDAELIKQMDETFIASKNLVAQGKKVGAQHILVGTLSNVEVEKETSSSREVKSRSTVINSLKKVVSGSENYKASLSYSLQIIDVETGKTVSQRTFNKTTKSVGISFVMVGAGNSEEEAIVNAIKGSKESISSWIDDVYRNKIKIMGIEEKSNNGKVKTILVSGLSKSVKEGTKYIVLDIEMLEGLKREKEVATISFVKNEGEVSICKVIDGHEYIEKKLTNYVTIKTR